MKSAWMLITMAACVLASVSGCMQPSWGVSPPVGWQPTTAAQSLAAPPTATAPATASAERSDTLATDPAVAELTAKIEALASRLPAAPASQPVASEPVTSAPAVVIAAAPASAPAPGQAAASPAPVNNNTGETPVPHLSAGQTPVSHVSAGQTPVSHLSAGEGTVIAAAPQAAPIAVPQPAPAPVVTTQPAANVTMVANAPTVAVTDMESSRTEVAASPSPRSLPVIQPTPMDTATPKAPPISEPTSAPLPIITVAITEIRPVVTPVAGEANAGPAAANQPAQAEQPARAANLESIIEQLEQTLQQKPPHPEDELRLRLLYLAAGREEKLAAPVQGMDPIQSELLGAIVKAVASTRQAMLEPLNASPSALSAADELRRILAQQSGVSIPRVALVTKVSSYGDYELISPLRFKAGSEIHAYVYTEVANFRCEPVEGDRLRTLLGERVQVFDAAGTVVWERHEKEIEDRVRTPRRDFFIPFPMRLPATLAPGEYVIKVTIEDQIGGTTDQQRLSFTIQ